MQEDTKKGENRVNGETGGRGRGWKEDKLDDGGDSDKRGWQFKVKKKVRGETEEEEKDGAMKEVIKGSWGGKQGEIK